MKQQIKLNKEQSLYVIPTGNGFTCLGFDVCLNRSNKLAIELGLTPKNIRRGTIAAYNEYNRLTNIARKKNAATGWRSQSELIPEFIGKEGQRVEVVTNWGETERYYIGKSTGFIPCHLEIKRSDSTGGGSVCGYPFKSIKFLGVSR
jgi:hypothetical protein